MTSEESLAWAKANECVSYKGRWCTPVNELDVCLAWEENYTEWEMVIVVHGVTTVSETIVTLNDDITPADLDVIVKAFQIPVTKGAE